MVPDPFDIIKQAEQAILAGPQGRASLMARPEYLELRAILGRQALPSREAETSWTQASLLAKSIAALGADLAVFVCLTVAVAHQSHWSALPDHLSALESLLSAAWEFCIPTRGRDELFRHLSRQLTIAAARQEAPAERLRHRDGCLRAISSLGQQLRQRGLPDLAEAQAAMQGWLATEAAPSVPAEQRPEDPVSREEPGAERQACRAPTNAAADPHAPAPATEPGEDMAKGRAPGERSYPPIASAPAAAALQAPTGVPPKRSRSALEREAQLAVAQYAERVRQERPADAEAYRMTRTVLWVGATTPARERGGRSPLMGPPAHLIERLSQCAQSGQWTSLLELTDTLQWTYPLWLDLQWWAHQALIGSDAASAATAVAQELLRLLDRCEGLAQASFANGVPFCSAGMLEWLEREMPKPVRQETAPESAPDAGRFTWTAEPSRSDQAETESVSPGEANTPHQRMRALQSTLFSARQERDRFALRLEMARLAAQGGRTDVASPLVDHLLEQLSRYNLLEWEPELAEPLLELALRLGRESTPSRQLGLLDRLALLNPLRALETSLGQTSATALVASGVHPAMSPEGPRGSRRMTDSRATTPSLRVS